MVEQNKDSSVSIAKSILGDKAQLDYSIAKFTTYKVGGNASLFLEVNTIEDLKLVHKAISASDIEVLVIGKGSNMLISDDGFDGLAILMGEGFSSFDIEQNRIKAGASLAMPVLARRSVANWFQGLEWAVGIPGSVGGGVKMNAGGHGSQISSHLVNAAVFDLKEGHLYNLSNSNLDFSYRHSCLLSHQVVCWAEFEVEKGDKDQGEGLISEIVHWRRTNQPGGQNAGSVFTNPPGESAGKLIELAGCKGMEFRSAQVSEKHANFIQSSPNGSSKDIASLMEIVSNEVEKKYNIKLIPEVKLVGFKDSK